MKKNLTMTVSLCPACVQERRTVEKHCVACGVPNKRLVVFIGTQDGHIINHHVSVVGRSST